MRPDQARASFLGTAVQESSEQKPWEGQNRYNQQQVPPKLCYFCGNPFSPEHCRSCPAREATCNACKKKGQFAKICNTTKRRVSVVQQDGQQLDQEWGIVHVGDDSEPE